MTQAGTSDKPELNHGAIGFVDAVVVGLAATSPAYSLAAIVGAITAAVGVYAPGALLASFVPMALIATAFLYLNRVDQDCGTTFSWVTRAMGPWFGWIGGWAITMTGVLIVGSQADVGVAFFLRMIGQDGAAENNWIRMPLAIALILVLTWLCVLGTDVSARVQNVMIAIQVGALLVFAAVALIRVAADDSSLQAISPELSWFNPFGAGGAPLTTALLLGVFAYWGWEASVNLNEETRGGPSVAGRASLLSTFILLLTYLGVATAVLSYAGTAWLSENADEEEAVFALLAGEVMGGWDWVLLLSVAVSAIASTQTTIIPASRTGLSMARRHAAPASFGRIHPRHRTPDVSTWWVAGIAIVWYVGIYTFSENALYDSATALSLLVAFYYALSGIACAVYHRKHLTESARNLLLIGVFPLVGAGLLIWLLVLSARDMADPENSYSGQAWLGVGPPLVVGIGIFALGLALMLIWRARDRRYWQERPSLPDPDVVHGLKSAAPDPDGMDA